jgi:hypothetical protein
VVSNGTFYGVVAVLVAASLISSSFAASYFSQYQQQSSESQHFASELDAAVAQYRNLSASYQTSLSAYNKTISLLSQALASLNTTSSSYKEGSAALASLWKEYLDLAKGSGRPTVYSVNVLLEYGNGSKSWHNDTTIQPGWNAYLVTLVVVNGSVQATWYPSYGEHFVTGIQGVKNDASLNQGWLLWTLNSSKAWQAANVGPDEIPLYNGSTFAWTFCHYDPVTYAPLCSP